MAWGLWWRKRAEGHWPQTMDTLPPPLLDTSREDRFLNETRRAQMGLTLAPLAEIFIYPALLATAAAWANNRFVLPDALPWATVTLALLSGPLGVLWFRHERVGKRVMRLKASLLDHLERHERLPAGFGGHFVGYSPVNVLRQYNGLAVEDLGFLQILGPWLVFVGDHHGFALHQQQVAGVDWGFTMPDFFTTPTVCLRVQDQGLGEDREICFSSGEGLDATANRQQQAHLHQVLSLWQAADAPPGEFSRPFGVGPLPPVGEGGAPLRKLNMMLMLRLATVMGAGVAGLLGFLVGLRGFEPVPGGLLWPPAATLLAGLFALWPVLVWRE